MEKLPEGKISETKPATFKVMKHWQTPIVREDVNKAETGEGCYGQSS